MVMKLSNEVLTHFEPVLPERIASQLHSSRIKCPKKGGGMKSGRKLRGSFSGGGNYSFAPAPRNSLAHSSCLYLFANCNAVKPSSPLTFTSAPAPKRCSAYRADSQREDTEKEGHDGDNQCYALGVLPDRCGEYVTKRSPCY